MNAHQIRINKTDIVTYNYGLKFFNVCVHAYMSLCVSHMRKG